MSRPLVQFGSSGKHVTELQKLLNKWLEVEYGSKAKNLVPDGDFGTNTLNAVRGFQLSCFLEKDGKVGSMTWAALEQSESHNYFDLPEPFVAAPNKYQCWAGATAMLIRGNTPATTQPNGVTFEQLPNGQIGGLENSLSNMKKFASAHNLEIRSGAGYSCAQVMGLLKQRGRLMLNMKGVNSEMSSGSVNDSHLVILAGGRGGGTDSTTTITIYNPTDLSGERVSACSYHYFKSRYPNMLYQILFASGNSSSAVYGKD